MPPADPADARLRVAQRHMHVLHALGDAVQAWTVSRRAREVLPAVGQVTACERFRPPGAAWATDQGVYTVV